MIESPETPSQDPLRPIAIEDVVSGEFDQEAEGIISPILTKRVLPPQAESPKLHKVLAQAGRLTFGNGATYSGRAYLG